MSSNLEKHKIDLQNLLRNGENLLNAIQFECYPEKVIHSLSEAGKSEAEIKKITKELPAFSSEYQNWYSESLSIIKLILPDRLNDFTKLYEKPKSRKEILFGNYVIEDYLQGLTIKNGLGEIKLGPYAAIPQFRQQYNILKSVERRFESSLFAIKKLVQADLFDSELDSAKELSNNKFYRAAGALAGVVLEKHLSQVCDNHKLSLKKKNPTINDFNEQIKQKGIIDIPQWRFIQHLADIRNLCDHSKKKEPIAQDIEDMIIGIDKVIKTIC